MNTMRSMKILILSSLFLFGWAALAAAQTANDELFQVQTRGPVHEGFAGPIQVSPEPGMVVSQAPPEAVEEMPPDQRPDDPSAIWIPGYWGWDDDRNDFIWVSGIWRVPPPGYTWVPGYWTQVDQGYQWIPGFWTPTETQQIEYLPQPPATLEVGPSSPQPSLDQVWVPGLWYWRESRYAWRPGYWLTPRPDWVWVPANYVWTPRGVVFVDGYWDYPVERRGLLFAPVYVERRVVLERRVRFVPSIVIGPDVLRVHLFSRPRYTHYYFGDYYSTTYVRRGILPWFQVVERRRVYEPLAVHEMWRYQRQDPHWLDRVRRDYQSRVENVSLRPPRTYAAQRVIVQRLPERQRTTYIVGQSLRDLSVRGIPNLRLQALPKDQRQTIVRQEGVYRELRDQRVRVEARSNVIRTQPKGSIPTPRTVQPAPQRLRIPSALVPSKQAQQRTITLPPRPQAPKTITVPTTPKTQVQPRTGPAVKPPTETRRTIAVPPAQNPPTAVRPPTSERRTIITTRPQGREGTRSTPHAVLPPTTNAPEMRRPATVPNIPTTPRAYRPSTPLRTRPEMTPNRPVITQPQPRIIVPNRPAPPTAAPQRSIPATRPMIQPKISPSPRVVQPTAPTVRREAPAIRTAPTVRRDTPVIRTTPSERRTITTRPEQRR